MMMYGWARNDDDEKIIVTMLMLLSGRVHVRTSVHIPSGTASSKTMMMSLIENLLFVQDIHWLIVILLLLVFVVFFIHVVFVTVVVVNGFLSHLPLLIETTRRGG